MYLGKKTPKSRTIEGTLSQVYFDAENYVKCNEMKNINWILTKCNWSVFYFLQD